ncbi:AWS-like protein [Cynara cardunculus var. scolymus]|uniref:AWS-like protein n=1 Tax=Cynara cardunculus var. scolymus TaxID=59895 RepID=A0A103XN45_CYNCS|nr:AWS-like protein [Cynara cardunculus var. scolymus]
MPAFTKPARMSPLTLTRCPKNKQPVASEYSDFSDSNSSKTETLLPSHDEGGGNDDITSRLHVCMSEQVESTRYHRSDLESMKAECRVCENVIYPWEKVSCSIHDCRVSYHLKCAKERVGLLSSSNEFKCPQHACFLCKKKSHLWRCSKCDLASHEKCAAYPEYILHSDEKPAEIICWRHSTDWPPLKSVVPTSSIEEVFCRLPLPYVEEEFRIDPMWKCTLENKEPSSYTLIKRNLDLTKGSARYHHFISDYHFLPFPQLKSDVYLIKKKHDDVDDGIGCICCDSEICREDCLCWLQCISCSSACGCSEICANRPFRKNKKIQLVMTHRCGWGLEADEFIRKGDFIIEYVGEVINEALCEKRFWDMKEGVTNFYMCQVQRDFIIDATKKGNESRFLNHSCDPNCNLEK